MAQRKVNADHLPVGTALSEGALEIKEFISEGGFGLTYLTEDSEGVASVVKECFPKTICRRSGTQVGVRSASQKSEFERLVRVFVREARKLSKLSHPNIVQIRRAFAENGTAYMAMDYVDGLDLLTGVAEKKLRLTPTEIVIMTQKLLSALEYVHGEDMLHRDVSPDNILISKSGEPVLIDFGAAKENQSIAGNKNSGEVQIVKESYSPQEFHLEDAAHVPASDLYGLAATMYLAISKKAPINSATRTSEIAQQKPDPYVPLAGKYTGYPKGFLDMIDKAMAVFSKDRPQTASEWLAGFENKEQRQRDPEFSGAPIDGDAIAAKGMGVYIGIAAFAIAIAGGIFMFQLNSSDAGLSIQEQIEATTNSARKTPLELAMEAEQREAANAESQPAQEDQPSEEEVASAESTTTDTTSASEEDASADTTDEAPVVALALPSQLEIFEWQFSAPITAELSQSAAGEAVLVITEVTDAASDVANGEALVTGAEILSIDERPVSDAGSYEELMGGIFSDSLTPAETVLVELRTDGSETTTTVDLPVQKERTALLGDVSLLQREEGGEWQIVVADSPFSDSTQLLTGDILLNERITNSTLNRFEVLSNMISTLKSRSAASALMRVTRGDIEIFISLPLGDS